MTADPSSPLFWAVLLAAGRSTRFGQDKALVPLNGARLWRRQWDRLRRAGFSPRLLSVRPDQAWAPPLLRKVYDSAPEAGPIAGITAALETRLGTHLVVLAVDLPAMSSAWLRRLASQCRPGVGVIFRDDRGFEPLAAIYPVALLTQARQALDHGQFSLQALAASATAAGLLQVLPVTEADRPRLANLNQPGDWPAR